MRGRRFLSIITVSYSLAATAAEAPSPPIPANPGRVSVTQRAVDPSGGELKVSQINACGTLDRIPWASKSNGKRTRRIFRDQLRLDRDKTASTWELHQVLQPDGGVSFIFQRLRRDGKEEYIAAKGDTAERIMEVRKGRRRLIEKENMKPLINRTAISMMSKDGSRVEFIPGQTGKSTVVIYPTNDLGVSLAPVYLKGISCDKPETMNDDDINSKDLGMGAKEGGGNAPKQDKK